jgi:predicted  nucleic acid-binding Zn-ribbon protein
MRTPAKIIIIASSVILLTGGAYYLNEREKERQISFDSRVTSMMNERDSVASWMMTTLDEIDYKLDSIRGAKGFFEPGKRNHEMIASKKDQIVGNIFLLNSIITENSSKIKELQSRLDQMNSKNHAMRSKLEAYSKRNEAILSELAGLKDELAAEKEKVFDEKEKNSVLEQQVTEQNTNYTALKTQYDKVESDAYTAYYITGSKKQLSTLKVLEPKKVLNIPYTKKRVEYFPSDQFEKIDVREEAIIPTHTKRPVLVTTHAKESYVWQEDEDGMKNLCITKPEVFWQSSKYLVVQTK